MIKHLLLIEGLEVLFPSLLREIFLSRYRLSVRFLLFYLRLALLNAKFCCRVAAITGLVEVVEGVRQLVVLLDQLRLRGLTAQAHQHHVAVLRAAVFLWRTRLVVLEDRGVFSVACSVIVGRLRDRDRTLLLSGV